MAHSPVQQAKLMITFAHIAAQGSISGAAAGLGLDKGAVSRQLRALEELLDTRLMHRSTRRLVLTEAGAQVYERAQRLLQELEQTQADTLSLRSQPRGVLTVSASVAFGTRHLVPMVPAFMQRYPEVELQLCLLDRHVDPVEEGVDVLLRLCDTPPDPLVAQRLCAIDYAVVASPGLAHGAGVATPADLHDRPCLFYGFKSRSARWRFTEGAATQEVPVTTRVSVNSSEAVRDLAVRGLGFALLPRFAVDDDLAAGRLIQVLADHQAHGNLGSSLYALHLPGAHKSPKVRCFVDFVRERWSGDEPDWRTAAD
ncbi:LysR family transcriptional regulator [Rubrivivax gelatinosus]|uniref:Transcriptional regulator, LysR family n=1 Tax=Rubrivivax gelatinosus (strain NBRC 100245 / IL144) TaxID=983917 RepID=I0HWB4_RUBGI|nr:LysR family transcriptional regulator [Rubrivivax gelatinosus]BAL97301.1 transcriptional regulator, LysR family [Rubrivivax gelatinosus IL144]